MIVTSWVLLYSVYGPVAIDTAFLCYSLVLGSFRVRVRVRCSAKNEVTIHRVANAAETYSVRRTSNKLIRYCFEWIKSGADPRADSTCPPLFLAQNNGTK